MPAPSCDIRRRVEKRKISVNLVSETYGINKEQMPCLHRHPRSSTWPSRGWCLHSGPCFWEHTQLTICPFLLNAWLRALCGGPPGVHPGSQGGICAWCAYGHSQQYHRTWGRADPACWGFRIPNSHWIQHGGGGSFQGQAHCRRISQVCTVTEASMKEVPCDPH